MKLAHLPRRAVIAVAGEDRVAFLQGLVSNDMALVGPGRAVWAALLTPQGKWLADFFVLADGDRLLLDAERQGAEAVAARLARFRLRSRVVVQITDMAVHAAWDGAWTGGGVSAPDPRLPEAGWRVLSEAPLAATATEAEWDAHRLSLGLPDGARDLDAEKSLLLEAGFDELGGISWSKGCYMGQELTARTRYRGLIKRRLMPVEVAGPLPAPGTPILRDGTEVGTMRSGRGTRGLATLRLDALAGPLRAGEATLAARPAAWMRLPEPA